jgi:hypothetical protein
VSDLVVQAREGDLIVGAYGRGLWQTHIAPLREMGGDFLSRDVDFFSIQPFSERHGGAWGNYRLYGDRFPTTPNEPNGITIAYYLKKDGDASITIADAKGNPIRKLNAPAKAGVNRLVWNLNDDKNDPVPAGQYTVTLSTGGHSYTQKAQLLSRAPADSPRGRYGPGPDDQ